MSYLSELTRQEQQRQQATLNVIASENYPSPAVLGLLGSVWSNKYAEGYPGKRYYAGNVHADELEQFVQAQALAVFDSTSDYGVNVQVLSGSPANAMVFLTVLEAGDTVMSLALEDGGHLSHLHATSNYLKFFKHVTYNVKEGGDGFEIDLDDYKRKLNKYKPKLVIIGFSAYPRAYSFEPLIQAAHDAGALVLADIAHINGLVAAGLHDSPFKAGAAGADYVSMTTHKTMRGPRGALLFAKKRLMSALDKTVFPGTSGGPHLHQMAAIGQSLLEISGEEMYPDGLSFEAYSQAVITNAAALETGLQEAAIEIVTPTQTHLVLAKLPDHQDSLQVQQSLEALGIISNRNQIPHDPKTAWRPSGLRIGSAALTSRGLSAGTAKDLGSIIGKFILREASDQEVSREVDRILSSLHWYYEA